MTEPLMKEIWVAATVDRAFRRFTDGIDDWWPRATHSVSQDRCRAVHFGQGPGGRLTEEAEDGSTHVWGTVTTWEPPERVSFTWHPGRTPDTAQEVTVTFHTEGEGTRVRLVHNGWYRLGDAAEETRRGYDTGWDGVLGLYRDALAPVTKG